MGKSEAEHEQQQNKWDRGTLGETCQKSRLEKTRILRSFWLVPCTNRESGDSEYMGAHGDILVRQDDLARMYMTRSTRSGQEIGFFFFFGNSLGNLTFIWDFKSEQSWLIYRSSTKVAGSRRRHWGPTGYCRNRPLTSNTYKHKGLETGTVRAHSWVPAIEVTVSFRLAPKQSSYLGFSGEGLTIRQWPASEAISHISVMITGSLMGSEVIQRTLK